MLAHAGTKFGAREKYRKKQHPSKAVGRTEAYNARFG